MPPLKVTALLAIGLISLPLVTKAESLVILNSGLEEPRVSDVTNVSFDGTHGSMGKVYGWSSNEPDRGGVIRIDEKFPGRTGNNVLYLHGSPEQNFYTENFDLGEDLQSNTTYILCFDVLRWKDVTLDNTVLFRIGLYTGDDYESRTPLTQFEGSLQLVSKEGQPVDKVTITLVHTTGQVSPGTKFWIGGDRFNNANDQHIAHFDNFILYTATPQP